MAIDPRIKAYAAWPVLVEVAAARTTMTYEQLAARIGGSALRMRSPLDAIGLHCAKNGLPRLNAVIVAKPPSTKITKASAKAAAAAAVVAAEPVDPVELAKTLSAVHEMDWAAVKNPFRVFANVK
ncbi:MAG: hypothetical protein Q8O67_17190 [Deltaproteobacteria bacterium]|nr:hypothetical protein [Deltaproteobacteria bacterium]